MAKDDDATKDETRDAIAQALVDSRGKYYFGEMAAPTPGLYYGGEMDAPTSLPLTAPAVSNEMPLVDPRITRGAHSAPLPPWIGRFAPPSYPYGKR